MVQGPIFVATLSVLLSLSLCLQFDSTPIEFHQEQRFLQTFTNTSVKATCKKNSDCKTINAEYCCGSFRKDRETANPFGSYCVHYLMDEKSISFNNVTYFFNCTEALNSTH